MSIDITKNCHCMHGVICHACHTRITQATIAKVVAEVTARRDRAAKHRHAPYGDGCDDCGREKALDDLLDWLEELR